MMSQKDSMRSDRGEFARGTEPFQRILLDLGVAVLHGPQLRVADDAVG